MTDRCLVHATAIAIEGRGVLLRGPSGSGKSDLALRLIDAGARLVADDQSELSRIGDAVVVRPPAAIAGLIEVRGIGIIRVEPLMEVPLRLIADLAPAETIERLPAPHFERILGCDLPVVALAPFAASAVAKLRLTLRVYTEPGFPALLKA